MAVPIITALKMWAGTLFTKDDWDFNFSQIVSWLADGNADLVVNTIKTTNGIDLDGAQISNLGAATTGSQAVTLDQANTLLNRTSYYYPFSVASGKVNSTGNAAYLQKDSNTQITVLAGNVNPDLVCILSDGTIESVTSNTVLTVPTANGTYHIIKEKEQPISITAGASNKVTVAKAYPSTPNIGDYFCDNSTVPFKGYKYTSSGWVETPFCWLGDVKVSSGVATVTQFPYNDNYFDVNRNNQSVVIESYKNGASWYRIWSDGFIEQGGCYNGSIGQNQSVEVTLLKSFTNTNYSVYLSPKMNTGTTVQGPISFLGGYISAINKFKILNEGYAMSTMSGVYWRACGY